MSQPTHILDYEYLDQQALEMIEDLMDGDAEMIVDLVDTLIETTPELLHELEDGVKSMDPIQIREAAHALKSSSAQLGALNFSDLCREMEEKGKRKDLEDTEGFLALIQAEYQKVLLALNSWKAKLNTPLG